MLNITLIQNQMNPLIKPQPKPIANSGFPVADLVIADMEDRKQFGFDKYRTYLETNNGRNHLVDAYQEILDLSVYMRSHIEENWQEPNELW
jgi:hypothetical protein